MCHCPTLVLRGVAMLLVWSAMLPVIFDLENCNDSSSDARAILARPLKVKLKLFVYTVCWSSLNYEILLLKTDDLLASCLEYSKLLVLLDAKVRNPNQEASNEICFWVQVSFICLSHLSSSSYIAVFWFAVFMKCHMDHESPAFNSTKLMFGCELNVCLCTRFSTHFVYNSSNSTDYEW